MLPARVVVERHPRIGSNLGAIWLPFKLNNLQSLSWVGAEHQKLRLTGARVYSTSP
jgi:hypothetical protein